MTTDAIGNVYVAGATLNGAGNYDILVSKYADDGSVLWSDQLDGNGHGHDAALALAVDGDFNVYVTGTTYYSSDDTLDVIVIKYDVDGIRQWVDTYNGADGDADLGTCIALADGAIYVGGVTTDASNGLDFLAIKYEDDGTRDWLSIHDEANLNDVCTKITATNKDVSLVGATHTGALDWDYLAVGFAASNGSFQGSMTTSGGSVGFDMVTALDKDALGNIYLTGAVANGATGYDIHTVKIDSNLTVQWSATYTGSGNYADLGQSLALDASGNVYVGGYVTTATHATDFITLKYNSSGTQQWAQTWNHEADSADSIKAIVVDGSGNVIVTGTTWNGSSDDYHTIKYNPSGGIVWQISYNDKYNYGDRPLDIAVDPAGNVIVAGQSMVAPDEWAYVTVRYVAHTLVMPVDSDSVSTSLRFLANRDQLLGTDGNAVERVRYYSNQCYPNVYMMDDSLSYVFAHIDDDTTTADTMHRVDMSFVGGNAEAKLLPIEKEAYFNNYYLGHIPEGRPFVSLYKHLYMQDVWTGIDMEYSSNQRGLKYYFIVHPSIEPSLIGLRYSGQDDLSVDGNGALVMETTIGTLVQPQALAYEMDGNGELTLLGWQPDYVVSSGVVSFDGIGSYSGDLVIEVNWGYLSPGSITNLPTWSTFYGGGGHEGCADLDTDTDGNLYATGEVDAPGFPTYGPNIFQANYGGYYDAFIGKFKSDYSRRWMTYYGGGLEDNGSGVVADEVNNRVYACGHTVLLLNPLTTFSLANAPSNAYVQNYTGIVGTGFIAGLDRTDGSRVWATFFGSDAGYCNKLVLDDSQNLYVAGNTIEKNVATTCLSTNGDFPLCNSTSSAYIQTTASTGFDGFVAMFSPQTVLLWSTLIGGDGDDRLMDLAYNTATNQLVVGGNTKSFSQSPFTYTAGNCPATSSYLAICQNAGYNQTELNGDNTDQSTTDGLLLRFNDSKRLDWSTFFGGDGVDLISSVAISPPIPGQGAATSRELIIAGKTNTSTYGANCSVPTNNGFPCCSTSTNYHQPYGGGTSDAFAAKFGYNTSLLWSQYIGGGLGDGSLSDYASPQIAVDSRRNKYLIGTTDSGTQSSLDIPIQYNSYFYNQSSNASIVLNNAGWDAFIVGFDDAENQTYGTYFGGTGPSDNGSCIAIYSDQLFIGGGGGDDYGSVGSSFPLNDPNPPISYKDQDPNNWANGADVFFAQLQVTPFPVSIEPKIFGESPNLGVVPNPTNGMALFGWDSEFQQEATLDIFDILGRQVYEKKVTSIVGKNQVLVDLGDFEAGLYLAVLNQGNSRSSLKLIKQ